MVWYSWFYVYKKSNNLGWAPFVSVLTTYHMKDRWVCWGPPGTCSPLSALQLAAQDCAILRGPSLWLLHQSLLLPPLLLFLLASYFFPFEDYLSALVQFRYRQLSYNFLTMQTSQTLGGYHVLWPAWLSCVEWTCFRSAGPSASSSSQSSTVHRSRAKHREQWYWDMV